jgi:hypothetical protein
VVEPATGFMLQGQIAANLTVAPGLGYAGSDYSVMPVLRLGAQLPSLAVALEINYNSFTASHDSYNGGYHIITLASTWARWWRPSPGHWVRPTPTPR